MAARSTVFGDLYICGSLDTRHVFVALTMIYDEPIYKLMRKLNNIGEEKRKQKLK